MFVKTRAILWGGSLNFLLATTVLSWNNFIKKPVDSSLPIPICGTPIAIEKQEQAIRNTLLLRPELPPYLKKAAQPTEYNIGDEKDFYAYDYNSNSFYSLNSTCRAVTERTYIFVENFEWDNDNVTQTALDNFIEAFENSTPPTSVDPTKGIFALDSTYFGQPSDIDNDNHITILILDIKDDYDETGIYIGGYYNPNDQSTNAYSNKMDMIYIDSNPGNPESEYALATVAHEFQHLIHHNMDADEATWVNEGCSEYAECICGYGLRSPKYFLDNPDRSLVTWSYGTDVLGDYAKVALWTAYLGEQFGVDFMPVLVAEQDRGKTGVTNALSTYGSTMTCDSVITNWVIANFLDDPSLANGEYGYKSINFSPPSILNTHHNYPVNPPEEGINFSAAEYIKFIGEDTTARLYFDGKDNKIFKAQIIKLGALTSIEEIQLNSNNEGQFPLSGLGTEYQELVLVPTNFSYQSSYTYSVTTEVEDINPPQILAGPYESIATVSGVTISWKTDEFSNSIVEYGIDENYGQTITETTLQVTHQVTLSGLAPNTVYHYRVGCVDNFDNGPTYSADFTFTTSSLAANEVSKIQQAHSIGYSARNIARDSNNRIHLVWHELVSSRRYVYYSNSDDNGITWSWPVKIDTLLYYGGMPSLAIDSHNSIHVVWHAQALSTDNYAIYYSKSTNSGLEWDTPQNISTTLSAQDNLYPSIAVDTSDNPHVVWTQVLQPDTYMGEIYHNYSLDGGGNWETPRNISNSEQNLCFVPTIEFNSQGKAFVTYADDRILYYTVCLDYLDWDTPRAINELGYLYDAMHSFIIDHNDLIHVVYSDNYTPGDIRIMYIYFNGDNWSDPIPIAKSITGGYADYPHIGFDDSNNLYVVYRDNLASSLSKISGKYAIANRIATDDALLKTQAGNGDVFIVYQKGKDWSTPGNLSNDNTDSEYPEIASRVTNQALDLIWVDGNSAPFKLKYLNFGVSTEDDIPPQVISTYPSNDSTNIPIYKQVTQIKASFSKRILADSLNSSNVVIQSQTSGIISGTISYDESQKEMTFTANSNFATNDTITITLKASIVDLIGNTLDGDQDGIPECSPNDDYQWRFTTADSDRISPTFTIGVLQNPVFTRYMDMYVVPSEYLTSSPTMVVDEQNVPLGEIHKDLHIYKGDYKIAAFGAINISVSGTDLAGNLGSGTKIFAAELIIAKQGGIIDFGGRTCQLSIPPGALSKDEYVTIVCNEPDEKMVLFDKSFNNDNNLNLLNPTYTIGHSNLVFTSPARLRIYLPPQHNLEKNGQKLVIYHFDHQWIKMGTEFFNSGNFLEAEILKPGNYRIGYTENLIPEKFQLAQNYPNPFNHRTVIKYQIPENGFVTIRIYNMLGQMVKELINENQKTGYYEISWDGTNGRGINTPSGIYFYQITAGKFSATKKMLLLK